MNKKWLILPEEMRLHNSWCIASPDKNPLTVNHKGQLHRFDLTDVSKLLPFDRACAAAFNANLGIGFVLSKTDIYSDPYTCIDLDVKDAETHPNNPELWTTQDQFDRYWRIVQAFDSYTEKSRGGKGLHNWIRGNIGPGVKRDGVEVYSTQRYMICTGDPIINKPIATDKQDLLDILVSEIRNEQGGGHNHT